MIPPPQEGNGQAVRMLRSHYRRPRRRRVRNGLVIEAYGTLLIKEPRMSERTPISLLSREFPHVGGHECGHVCGRVCGRVCGQVRGQVRGHVGTWLRAVCGLVSLMAMVLVVGACDQSAGNGGAAAANRASPTADEAKATGAKSAEPAVGAQAAAPASAGGSSATSEDGSVDGPPPIELDPPLLDFGILPPSVAKEGTVRLVNKGNKELEVLTVQPSCKCTTIDDISGKKIPVGGSIELRATMKSQSAPGKKSADIKILIDGYSQVIPLQLKQEVSLPVRVSPSYLNVVKGQPTTGRIVIESIDKQPFTVCAIGGKKPNLIGFDSAKDAPRNQYLLDWDFDRDFAPGEAKRYWLMETDRADCPLVDIFVRHESTVVLPRGISPTEYRHTFGRLEQGGTYDFVLDLTKIGADEKIVAAASASSAAKVELISAVLEGEVMHVALRVVPNPDTLGLTWIPFTVYSSTGRQADQAVWGQYVPKGLTGCYGR